ncbi:hypothetical protein BDB00DRAFT_428859 [Zychaea mexicana]|uniref:uncharacterized protein n=1 Tax=Zychaea mexicana TaxID=64656 RepID=UPI0022FE168B|nr:uncharacterized protein BDB00DRAFT_428859 [Zychaea mexicana]KAI9492526.1 hypothetical protein BDB00DRAFT_428859 [Zychaea mexicana]
MKFNRHLPVLIWQIKFRKKALLASISLEILLIMPPKHGSTKRPSTNNEDSIVSQKRFIVNDVDGQHAINVNQEPYEKSNNDAINESASPANAKLRANLVQQGEHGKESKDASNSKVLVARNAAPQSFTSCHSAKHGTKVHCSSIDIFTRLPYDVALLIIDLLQQHAVAECTRVCSAWRALVLDYSKPWCHIEATSWGRTRALPPYKLLPSVSQHVQEIRLLFSNQALNCIKLLRTENFHNLRVLHIQERKQSLYSELCSALPNVANTLTMLDLYIGRDDDVPYLAPILSICRNLTRLKFDSSHKDNSKAFSTMFSLSHTTRLTEIELLSRDSESIQAERLESLIQHSPHIQWVLLYNFTTDVYETVRLHCPGIKYLMIARSPAALKNHY